MLCSLTNTPQSFVAGVIAFKVLPRPQFATLQSATFPIYFPMQTVLAAIIAATFPGTKTVLGTRDASGFAGVMADRGIAVTIGTMFVTGLINWVYLGPETYKCMKARKHQGMSCEGGCGHGRKLGQRTRMWLVGLDANVCVQKREMARKAMMQDRIQMP